MQSAIASSEVFDLVAFLKKRKDMSSDELALEEARLNRMEEELSQQHMLREGEQSRLQYVKQLDAAIPSVYRHRLVDELRVTQANRKAIDGARDWLLTAEDNLAAGRGYWISGPPGCGKTALISALAYGLPSRIQMWRPSRQRGVTAFYINWAAFICKSILASEKIDYSKLEQAMKQCDVLLLDDLGAEPDSKYSRALAFSVINHRCAHQKTVLIASNLKKDDRVGLTGARVVDRLLEMCPARYRHQITGSSFRRHLSQLNLPRKDETDA